jgi:site-specific DNA-methyltransferase (cytosine-N4-specific)
MSACVPAQTSICGRNFELHVGDCSEWLKSMCTESVQSCITSPPYFGLRDYGADNQIGLENTYHEYISRIVNVFSEVYRVLASDGVLLLNIGDSYSNFRTHNRGGTVANSVHKGKMNGNPDGKRMCGRRAIRQPNLKDKDLIGIPWRVAFALQENGWYLRQEIRWIKPNPKPDKFRDRCVDACESVFILTKNSTYFFDARAIADTNRNGEPCPPTNAWRIQVKPVPGHHATMPSLLARRLIMASTNLSDTVIDPFTGSGTTGIEALRMGRKFLGCELNPEYASLAVERLSGGPLFSRPLLRDFSDGEE